MHQDDALWEALPALLRAARTETAIRGAGVARRDEAADVVVTYADALGAGSSRLPGNDLPPGVRPGAGGSWRLAPGDASWRDDGFVESRVFQAVTPTPSGQFARRSS
jgi:hypothetical protein